MFERRLRVKGLCSIGCLFIGIIFVTRLCLLNHENLFFVAEEDKKIAESCFDSYILDSKKIACFTSHLKTLSSSIAKSAKMRIMEEKKLHLMLYKNCRLNIDSIRVRLDSNPRVVLTMREYKKQYARNYTDKYSTFFDRIEIQSTLSPLLKPGPNPENVLLDPGMLLNVVEMSKEQERLKEKRIKTFGDDDILNIPEVINELANSEYKIPNLVHFVSFGYNDFLVHHYMALVGAWRYQKPSVILYHCDKEPSGEYWMAVKKKCGNTLKVVKRSSSFRVYQHPLHKWEHKSDVARLQILMEVGGIYLDTDSVVLRSLDAFRNHEMVIGEPHRKLVAENAIILANKDAWFLKRWYYEYRNFKKDSWGFNSLEIPGSIAYFFPKSVHLTYTELCRPHWEELNMIYHNLFDWQSIFVMHLYQRLLPRTDKVPQRPLKQLAVLNTTYGEVARHVIWGNKTIRDVTDWIVTCDLEKFLEI